MSGASKASTQETGADVRKDGLFQVRQPENLGTLVLKTTHIPMQTEVF